MGEKQNRPFQLSFNASLKIDFQGSRITSDGGLILVRELDERLGFGEIIAQHLTDSRRAMIQRNRADQDVRAGGVFVEGIEKTGVRDFGFCEQRESPVLQGRKRLREEECGGARHRSESSVMCTVSGHGLSRAANGSAMKAFAP